MPKRKIAIILIMVLLCGQNFIYLIDIQSRLKTKDNPINEDFEINNISVSRYSYRYYQVDNNIIYLFDPWNYRIGIYDLENKSNPEQITEGHFYETTTIDPLDDFNEIYNIKDYKLDLVNLNDSYLTFKTYDIHNCLDIQQISSKSIEHNLTLSHYKYNYYTFLEDQQLYIFIVDNHYNETDETMSYWLHNIEVNITIPSLPIIEKNYAIFNEVRNYKTQTFTYYNLHYENNYLFYYRHIRNVTGIYSNGHYSNIKDNSYELLVFDQIDISTPIMCSQKNFTTEFYSEIMIENQIVYYKNYDSDLDIYNYTNPYQPKKIGSYSLINNPLSYILNEQILYLVRNDRVDVLEIKNNELEFLRKFHPHGIVFNMGLYKDNYLILISPAENIEKIFVILDCSNPEKMLLVYPEKLVSQFWFNFSIIFPIITSVIIFVTIILPIYIKKRSKKIV
ncbi:MAG: hypothetical protein FK730_04735 [Asgard group archaeon]|nr:hypothetical protein [Asgard group archaeon]